MSTRSAKQHALIHRRKQVSELRLQGWTQQAIADHLGIPQTTVSLDLKTVRREWEAMALGAFDEMRTQELQKLERLEREAWAAWERSQKPAQSVVADGDAKKPARKTVKNQHGNPRFLQIVQGCIAAWRALLGLDAPSKVAPTSVEGRTITLTDLLGRIRSAAPPPPAGQALAPRSNVFDLAAEFARRAPPGEAAGQAGGGAEGMRR
ncbi:MAG TPA: helix-turn-helix domain-containing protein [Pirellulales bacterium]|nr:helix-turn-helix domain-containing protein [Pirellulales bacterium]